MTIKERCEEVWEYFTKKVTLAEQTQDPVIISVVCLSILDCLAQENAKYRNGKNEKIFTDFVKKYSDSDILDCVNYITLYYANTENFNLHKVYINKLLSSGNIYTLPEVCEIFEKVSLSEIPLNKIDSHKFVNQLWFYRNKVMHEHNTLSNDISKNTSWISNNVPYFYSCESNWLFCIPAGYIKKLLLDCLENYLHHCEKINQDPFDNNTCDRPIYLAWVK